ncbi:MBL fold metallo-hydrolase [Pseudomonas sp. Bout1]|uniref:MBL fold metallo-hydrolase n=1 Tax=Pseudomonas sp. Bout1 TaxID=3048600 RepID=UPI002AB3744E|nr:MBL fold metallo-hydrolase [Pseudomonas sp. Bout1]MDY7533758.1 MBL fold metallo-hydrolase [Pseudomonas sp. Bout1]MEB0186867.1 MBL fold metallo-hydrolase [Pseudomonas sp. Bout1]
MLRNMCIAVVTILWVTACSSRTAEVPTVPGTVYVPASKFIAIEPGQKIEGLVRRYGETDYTLQKVGGGLYVMFSRFYNVPFYVGSAGVLVFDPAAGSTESLLQAVKSVTDLPVTSLVYSHHHQDHIDGSRALVEAMKTKGVPVEVVATLKTAEILSHTGADGHAPVTRVVDVDAGQADLQFEDLHVKVVGFKYPTHSLDQSVFVIDAYKVVIAPDFVSPDQFPFFRFSYNAGNTASYIDNLHVLNGLAWNKLIGGHGNFGSKEDVKFLIGFVADLEAAVRMAVASAPDVDPMKYGSDSAIPYLQEPYIIKSARSQLDGKYARYSGYAYVIDSFIQEAIVYTATGVQTKRE